MWMHGLLGWGMAYGRVSPKGTFVFLEGFVDEHVPLHFVLPVERCVAEGALVWLFT